MFFVPRHPGNPGAKPSAPNLPNAITRCFHEAVIVLYFIYSGFPAWRCAPANVRRKYTTILPALPSHARLLPPTTNVRSTKKISTTKIVHVRFASAKHCIRHIPYIYLPYILSVATYQVNNKSASLVAMNRSR